MTVISNSITDNVLDCILSREKEEFFFLIFIVFNANPEMAEANQSPDPRRWRGSNRQL